MSKHPQVSLHDAITRQQALVSDAVKAGDPDAIAMKPVTDAIIRLLEVSGPPAIELVEPSDPRIVTIRFTSKSTIITTTILVAPNTSGFFRVDLSDLNLPESIFVLAGKEPLESQSRYEFLYHSADEAINAYVEWFAWAISLHQKEAAESDGAA